MSKVWLIYNPASGTTDDTVLQAITEAVLADGDDIAGQTRFPQEPLPKPDDMAGIDTVMVAAGDGTINAVTRALERWPGRLLVLPGGTMNVLPKLLHGTVDIKQILRLAAEAPAAALPIAQAGEHKALVGALIGPAASWVHAREAVRHGKWHRLRRAIRLAWVRSFSDSIRIVEHGRRSKAYRAIFIAPDGDQLRVVKISARGFRQGVSVGWAWMRGDVAAADGVSEERTDHIVLAATKPTFALFDGEPAHLPAGAHISCGMTRVRFVTTAR